MNSVANKSVSGAAKNAVTSPVEFAANTPAARSSDTVHAAQRLIEIFSRCFRQSQATELVAGAQEPLYLPAQQTGDLHRLFFREDYFASALHEIAHWCIAGEARRLQQDFGYWYAPDGRDEYQQAAFQAVEFKPQALEWLFCVACEHPFRISLDNLDTTGQGMPDASEFCRRIHTQAERWQQHGLPARAAVFCDALSLEFHTGIDVRHFDLNVTDLR